MFRQRARTCLLGSVCCSFRFKIYISHHFSDYRDSSSTSSRQKRSNVFWENKIGTTPLLSLFLSPPTRVTNPLNSHILLRLLKGMLGNVGTLTIALFSCLFLFRWVQYSAWTSATYQSFYSLSYRQVTNESVLVPPEKPKCASALNSEVWGMEYKTFCSLNNISLF